MQFILCSSVILPLRFYQWVIYITLMFDTRSISPLKINLSSFIGISMALGSPAVKCAKVCGFRGSYIIRFIYWFILDSGSGDKCVSFVCV